MNNASILLDQQRLEALFDSAAAQPAGSQLQDYLTQHLCVRLSGFIEQSVRSICYEYARQRGHTNLAAFVSRIIERHYQNLNTERLCQLAGRFSADWEKDLRSYLTEEHKDAFTSILNNRHKISHGESVPTLGLVRLRRWYEKVVDALQFLEATASSRSPRTLSVGR